MQNYVKLLTNILTNWRKIILQNITFKKLNLKIFDIKIKISFLFVAFLSLMLVIDATHKTLLCIFATLLHEFGHMFAILLLHKKIYEIRLNLSSIDIVNKKSNLAFKKEIFITISGSLMNFLAAVVINSVNSTINSGLLRIFFVQNVLIGMFNLLPISTLDGGQLLFLMLEKKFSHKTAYKITQVISCLTLIPIAILSFIIIFNSKYNFSLLFLCIYLIFFIVK